MSIFYAFHVVTEHRMYLGQHIIFDEGHHNGVYERVMDKLPVVKDIYAHSDKYAEKELDYPTMVALQIKVNGNIFAGDAIKCFDGTIDKASNLIMAERYWKNEDNAPDEPPINEILVSGDLEVAEILKEYGNI